MQRLLFRYFLRRNHPVIVTTHSPNIASVAPIESLVLLKATAKGYSEGHAVAQISFSDQERDDLQRYIDVTRAEIVFAKGVVLVEGPAEQFLLPALGRFLKDDESHPMDFDRIGVSVCPVFGTDFAPYLKLLGPDGLSVPHVVITDGDPKSEEGSTIYHGIRRGARLVLESESRETIEKHIEQNKWSSARKLLNESNIFVGKTTLEIELLDSFSKEIKETYAELTPSGKAATSFGKLVDEATGKNNPEIWDDIMSRIERRGKGRFAQRLATKVEGSEPPDYIQKALVRIATLVKT